MIFSDLQFSFPPNRVSFSFLISFVYTINTSCYDTTQFLVSLVYQLIFLMIVTVKLNRKFLSCLTLYIYIYIIYIYCHPQTDCSVRSELFSVARHAGRSKPGSKPVQLYVRLSFRPLGHQANHVG